MNLVAKTLFKNSFHNISNDQVDLSALAVFKEKSFAIFTVNGFVAIAGAEYGKVKHNLQNKINFVSF